MNYKITGITFIVGMLMGAGLYYKFGPSKETIKTQVVEKQVVKDNIKTVTVENDKPDGTKQVTTTVIDNTVKDIDTTSKEKETLVVPTKPSTYHVSVGYLKDITKFDVSNSYQLTIERKILGPFSLGITGTSDKQIGVTLGFEF